MRQEKQHGKRKERIYNLRRSRGLGCLTLNRYQYGAIFSSHILETETYIQDIKRNNKGAGSPSLPSRYKRKGFEKKKTKGEKKGTSTTWVTSVIDLCMSTTRGIYAIRMCTHHWVLCELYKRKKSRIHREGNPYRVCSIHSLVWHVIMHHPPVWFLAFNKNENRAKKI